MEKSLRELLLKDLCARLPYNVIVRVEVNDVFIKPTDKVATTNTINILEYPQKFRITPYLRPMSSMTDEERSKLSRLSDDKFKFYLYTGKPEIICYEKYNYLEGLKVLDWLNEHHFDYRGLIPKGLALEASENMYK